MLTGIDISSYQGNPNFDTLKSNIDFAIFKATEGVGFTDPKLLRNQAEARRVGLACGYYGFVRPDLGNSPESEAQYFINSLWPARAGELFILDFEVRYANPIAWCKKWLDYVASKTNGTKPLIYLNKSLVQSYDWTPIINAGYGLWLAYYDNNPNDIPFNTSWPVVAMKQYTSSGRINGVSGNVDVNSFYGSLASYKKYGYIAGSTVDPYKEKCSKLKIGTSRIDTELGKDLSAASPNYEAIFNSTIAKLKTLSTSGTL